jgi:hypothetical protein
MLYISGLIFPAPYLLSLQMRVSVDFHLVRGDALVHTSDALFNHAQAFADNALPFFSRLLISFLYKCE